MSEADDGIEKETISFGSVTDRSTHKTLEIKHTISGNIFKTRLPLFQNENAEDILHFLYEFEQVRTKLGCTPQQNLESDIEQLLKGTAHNECNTLKKILWIPTPVPS